MPIIRSCRLYRYSQHVAHNCKDGTLESVENSIVRIVLSCVVYPVCHGGGVNHHDVPDTPHTLEQCTVHTITQFLQRYSLLIPVFHLYSYVPHAVNICIVCSS